MSLRKFHIFFIAVSGLLALGMIFWGLWFYRSTGQVSGFLYSGLGVAGAILLWRYLKWFLQKYSQILALASGVMLAGILSLSAHPLWACGVCYQDPESQLTKASLVGAGFLGVVVYGVLFGILAIAKSWKKRAEALNMEL